MTICSWRMQSAQILINSNNQHAKLHIGYARRKAVLVVVLVAGIACPILMLLCDGRE